MKISIQLQQDNGTVTRAVTRDVTQANVDRVTAMLRDEYNLGSAPTALEVFDAWANEMLNWLRAKTKRYEKDHTAVTDPI